MKRFAPLLIPLWFALLMPWGVFTDPDAFFHTHLSALILERGPITAFPWLDLTTLGTAFADQHFLFHVATIPAIALARIFIPSPFADFWAAQIMAVVFATVTTLTLWTALKRMRIAAPGIWVALTLLVPGFSMRLLLGKASPLTITLFIATIWAMATRGRFRTTILFACGALFALTHGGWVILVLAAIAIALTDLLLHNNRWKHVLALLGGILTGLLLHPNRDTLFPYLYTQIVTAAIAPPTGLLQGIEWTAPPLIELIGTLAPLLIPLLLVAWALCRAPRITRERLRTTILLFLPVALTLALTLQSRKFIEYLAPALALFTASAWMLVDPAAFRPLFRTRVHKIAIATGIIAIIIHHAWGTYAGMREPHARPFNAYQQTVAAIAQRAAPGDRVFHSSWDEFPTLFATNDSLRYVSGLDPAFLYDANPALARDIQALTLSHSTTTAWNIIAERTGSRFVFVTHGRFPTFDQLLTTDRRFHEIARNEQTAAYEIHIDGDAEAAYGVNQYPQ